MSDVTLEQVIQLADQLSPEDQLNLRQHLAKDNEEYPDEWIKAREAVRAKLRAAGALAEPIMDIDEDDLDVEPLTDDELENWDVELPPGAPSSEELVNEDRGPR